MRRPSLTCNACTDREGHPWAGTPFGKILGIHFPTVAFVLSGYEQSIANMYFLPAGLLAEGRLWSDFGSIFHNLIPVTIGNIIGGTLVVILHPARARELARTLRIRTHG